MPPLLSPFTIVLLAGCIPYHLRAAQRDTGTAVVPGMRVMQLNRTGHWDQAAELAQRLLAVLATDSTVARCELSYGLAYAQLRLERNADATATMNTFDRACAALPPDHWVRVAGNRVRAELEADARGALILADDGFWQTTDPASASVDSSALERHRALCERSGADACLVARRSKIVQEWYSLRYRTPIMAMSSTKSVTGLLVGMLLDDGKIPSIDTPVCAYVTQWCAGDKARVTLRHLLTMTSGLPRMYAEGVGSVSDTDAFVINLALATPPGTTWAYSNEGVQLLSPILDKAAGEPIQDYARRRLFEPLGMRETRLHLDETRPRVDLCGHGDDVEGFRTNRRTHAEPRRVAGTACCRRLLGAAVHGAVTGVQPSVRFALVAHRSAERLRGAGLLGHEPTTSFRRRSSWWYGCSRHPAQTRSRTSLTP